MKKLFVAILALGALASCQKENVEIINDNETKTITLSILNEGTRVDGLGGDTKPGTDLAACADAADLVVLFADANGKVLYHDNLATTGTTDNTHKGEGTSYVKDEKTGSYMWHMVPAAVKQIAVVRFENGDITITDNTTTLGQVEALARDEAKNLHRELSDIILYGAGTLTDTGTTHRVGSVVYHVWSTSVTVAPKFARLEVRGLECTDLGVKNADEDDATYGFDELHLKSLTWSSTASTDNFYSAPGFGTVNEKEVRIYGAYNPAAGKIDTNTHPETEGRSDALTPKNGAWSWNVLPCTFEKMVLDIDAYAYDYTITNGDRSFPLTVIGLTAGERDAEGNIVYENGLNESNIYVFNLNFTEGNISAQDQICVDVTVVITPWTVVNRTPIYQ